MSVYSTTVQMLECKVGEPFGRRSEGVMEWKEIVPKITGKESSVPKGRADTDVVYDKERQRLLFFGGASCRVFFRSFFLKITKPHSSFFLLFFF